MASSEIAPSVIIQLARCGTRKSTFGVRVERSEGSWLFTWAFPIKETSARRENYGTTKITGSFAPASSYPGCSHCGSKALVKCECGEVTCFDGASRKVRCAWCGAIGKISGQVTELRGGRS